MDLMTGWGVFAYVARRPKGVWDDGPTLQSWQALPGFSGNLDVEKEAMGRAAFSFLFLMLPWFVR